MTVDYELGGRVVRVDLLAVVVALSRAGLTRAVAAKQCDVSDRTFRRFLNGHRVTARTMNRILSGLDLEASDVLTYVKPGGK